MATRTAGSASHVSVRAPRVFYGRVFFSELGKKVLYNIMQCVYIMSIEGEGSRFSS